MSKSLQQLKDKQLQEFDLYFDSVFTTCCNDCPDRKFHVGQLKSFLSHSIELAYEEGKKEKPMNNNFLQVGQTIECGSCFPDKYVDCKTLPIKCDCKCHTPQPTKKCDHIPTNEYPKCPMGCKPPEKNDWEKEAERLYFQEGITIDDWINFIKSHRQELLEEIRGKVETLKVNEDMRVNYLDQNNFITLKGRRGYNQALNDLLKELK